MSTSYDYETGSLIQENIHISLYRGILKPGDHPILIKELKETALNPKSIARFRHDFQISQKHKTPASLEAYSLVEHNGKLALCLEDFEGVFLSDLMSKGTIPNNEFFTLAIAITRAVGLLHTEHIIHKNLNPGDILCSIDKSRVKILDFSIATTLAKETPTDVAGSILEGTLAYMSPEQTGRMNISLDYRSDFYALGVIFYQLLTGRLPFTQTDTLGLIHAHLALAPEPPHQVKQSIPIILSNIVLKLLDKRPDRRYQTANGLLHDLEKTSKVLEKNLNGTFELGQGDINPTLQISSKLYGRDEAIEILQKDYDLVLAGNKCLTLVVGPPGIGKTSLVNELYKPITERAGFFIRGKFDQLQYSTPYSALSQAFTNGIRQILVAPEDEVARWRISLNEALAPNGQILVNIIPQLELLIGKQTIAPTVDPTQEENRLFYVFDRFIRILATEQHPLTLFLDDLQWIDPASLKLLKWLFNTDAARWLYFVGAYRDTEVSDTHPLIYAISQLKQDQIDVHHLQVGPLSEKATTTWLADTLSSKPSEVKSLVELCYKKTAGNPFFFKQFVQALYEDRLLRLNQEKRRWEWDAKDVEKKQMTDNVIELMTAKMNKLSQDEIELLKLASCIGNHFELDMLVNITNKPRNKLSRTLWKLFKTGLILPENEEYKYMQEVHTQNIGCYFLHDRVQESAYSLMDEDARQQAHLNIGRLLLKHTSKSDQESRVFDIVNQLNEARNLITERAEKDELAGLNLQAVNKSIQSTAFTIAKRLIHIGLELFGKNPWKSHYDQTLVFYQSLASCHVLLGELDKAQEMAQVGIINGKDALDRSGFYFIATACHTINSEYEAGVDMTIQGLKELGLKFPKYPKPIILFLHSLK